MADFDNDETFYRIGRWCGWGMVLVAALLVAGGAVMVWRGV